MRSGTPWLKAALFVALVSMVPACNSNNKKAAPQVVKVLPAPGASSGIAPMPNIIIKFDQAMDPAFVSNSAYYAVIPDGATSSVPITVDYLPALDEVRIIPTSFLTLSKGYTVLVSGAVQSAAGTPLGNNVGLTFTTKGTNNATGLIGFGPVTQTAGGTSGQIILAWPTATESTAGGTANITAYDIYLSTTQGGEDLLSPLVPPQKTSGNLTGDTLTGLTPATVYYIKVQPRDGDGNVFTSLSELTATSN